MADSTESAVVTKNQLGKRYRCEVCGTEVLCTKGGEGRVHCCGQPMTLQQPRALPSSD